MDRRYTNKINWILDNLLPPVLRDNKRFMSVFMRIILGQKYKYYMEFKDRIPYCNENEINDYYTILADTFIKRDTDLNQRCIDFIKRHLYGDSIIDAAAGRGYLASAIKRCFPEKRVMALDIVLPQNRENEIEYVEGSLTNMPFEDKIFDTVICTHALEHIKDIDEAVSELRRICKHRLIIVLPRQKEYHYTFDLHINFFPYKYSIESLMKNKNGKIKLFDNDWVYLEDIGK